MDKSSGVGVLDKAAVVLGALEAGPSTLAQLVRRPAGPSDRAPAGRRAGAPPLRRARHAGPLRPRARALAELAAAAGEDRLLAAAGPLLHQLSESTGESAQLFRRQGDERVCVSAAERPAGLRDTIPVGLALTMLAGSAAQVLLAWEEPERLHRGLQGARFNAPRARRGYAARIGPRASVSGSRAWRRCQRPYAAQRPGGRPPSRCPARSSASPASPAACTPRPSSPPRPR
jgi:hypothetical protein